MLRSIFFATGMFVALWGVSLLFIDSIVLKTETEETRAQGFRGLFSSSASQGQKVFDPPDWAAFSLMSIGSVTMLYAVALPNKKSS